jgi:hypothetical protein
VPAVRMLRSRERMSRSSLWGPLVAAGFGAAALAGAALPWLMRTPAAAPLSAGELRLVIVLAGLVSIAGALVRRLREGTAMAVSLVLLAAVPVPGADAVLPLLVSATAALGALVVASWTQGPAEERPWVLVRAAIAAPVALVVVIGAMFLPPRAPDLPHHALAQWITGPGAVAPVLTAPATVWADLVRNGVPADRLAPAGDGSSVGSRWEIAVGERPAGAREAVVFGSGDEALTVIPPG